MGYFSNGTEGEMFEARYCANCIHRPTTPEALPCPVWHLHMLWNYDAVGAYGDKTKRTALETFITRGEDGRNQQCRMFVPIASILDLVDTSPKVDEGKHVKIINGRQRLVF